MTLEYAIERALDQLWEFTNDEYSPKVLRAEHIRILQEFADLVLKANAPKEK